MSGVKDNNFSKDDFLEGQYVAEQGGGQDQAVAEQGGGQGQGSDSVTGPHCTEECKSREKGLAPGGSVGPGRGLLQLRGGGRGGVAKECPILRHMGV